jgi:hypothetical protein
MTPEEEALKSARKAMWGTFAFLVILFWVIIYVASHLN